MFIRQRRQTRPTRAFISSKIFFVVVLLTEGKVSEKNFNFESQLVIFACNINALLLIIPLTRRFHNWQNSFHIRIRVFLTTILLFYSYITNKLLCILCFIWTGHVKIFTAKCYLVYAVLLVDEYRMCSPIHIPYIVR